MTPENVPFLDKLDVDVMLSGGAKGADTAWGIAANNAGHQVVHWSFEGHKSFHPKFTYKLTQEELEEADKYLEEANKTLKRSIPYFKPWIANLLRRNWYQVKYIDAIYAVGTLNKKAAIKDASDGRSYPKEYKDTMGVNGGTAWACQMFVDRWNVDKETYDPPEEDSLSANPSKWFPPYTFIFCDQENEQILHWNPHAHHWVSRNEFLWPTEKPQGIYAAVGTRALNDFGKAFIEEMYNQ